MIKKTTLIAACLLTSMFVKAQVSNSKNSSNLLTEEKITQCLENSRKNGIHNDEIAMQKKALHQKLKQQNEAIANGTFGQRTVLPPPHVNTSACTNPGFENGTNSDWNFYNGNISGINLPCDTFAGAVAGGINTVVSSASTMGGQCTNGIDNYAHFPVVAPGSTGGSYSLLLNDVTAGGKIQHAQYSFLVTAGSNNYFTYQYALVLQSGGPSHLMNQQAYFSVEMTDVTTNSVIPCSPYQQSVPNTGTIAGWSISTVDNSVYYKPWSSVSIDLSAYIGHNIAVNFIVSDCDLGGHFGYAYIDAACGIFTNQITQSNILCTGGSTTLQGPSGLNSYSWAGPVTGTSQNLVTSIAGTYTLSSTSGTGCAAPDIYYTLTQSSTTAPIVTINASNDTICANATTTLTASGASSYTWSDNETSSSISISPSNNVTFTVTGTDNVTGCVNYATQLIAIKQPLVNVTMQTSANYTCAGTPLTFTVSGADTYTWSTGANTNTITVSPTANTNYSATGTDTTTGCTNTGLLFIYVANNDTLINSNDSICLGGSAYLSAGGGIGTYTWSVGGVVAPGVTVVPSVTTTYTVNGSGGCPGTSTHTTTVYVKPLPNVTLSATALCAPTVTLIAGGASTYSWSTYETTPTITVSTAYSQSYLLTGIGTNMCSDTVSIRINNSSNNVTPFICMATTDSTTSYAYNYLVWDKTAYTNVDSFLVYRFDVLSSNYLKIGAVSGSALSQFKDTAFSIGGPNGGNPQYASWQYKLAILDSCGNISQYSPYHQTMFVQQNGGNFTWNAYTVESGQTNPVIGYTLLRDDNNTSNWHVLVNTNTLAATDPNYASYPNGNWRVEALGFNCTATLRLASNNSVQNSYMKSSSNTLKPLTVTGINKITANDLDLMLYPNPTNNMLNVVCKVKNTKLYITDMLGKRVMQVNAENELISIDVSQLSNGIYFLNTNTANGLITKKFVVQQ